MASFSATHFIKSSYGHRNLQSFGTSDDWKKLCNGKRLEEGLQAADCMLKQGKPITRDIAYHLLQGCTKNRDLEAAKLVLTFISESNLDLVAPLGDPLIRLFASHGQLVQATHVFIRVKNPSSHSWQAIISAHVALKQHRKSLALYHRMLDCGFQPSKFMFSCVLKACACTATLRQGMLVHHQSVENCLETDVVVGSALICLYAKCGCLDEARRNFDQLKLRNVVSYNTMMAGYVQHRKGLLAWELFEKMQQDGVKPDEFTFSCILKACGISEAAMQGASVHEKILEGGVMSNVVVGNALVDMYFKCGNIAKAREVFDKMKNRDVVSWNTLFMGYSSLGHGFEALILFEKMQQEEVFPNKVTYLCILKACCPVSAEEGRWAHDKTITSGLASDMEIGSALVFMYAQCGSLADARRVFDKLSSKDIVLWCTMIAAYAQQGCSLVALELYDEMQADNVPPDNTTFVCILKACANVKALCRGKLVHKHILACGLGYDVAVRNTLINMYIKCGSLGEACKLFEDFPNKNLVSWDAMMAGYTQNELGFPALKLFEKMLSESLKPDNVSFLCALKASGYIGAILQGKLIHDLVCREGLELNIELGNSLIDMYAKCGSLEEARRVFELVPECNLASWGALISGYGRKDGWSLAGQHLDYMQRQGFKPGDTMYTAVLAVCSQAGHIEEGYRQFTSVTEDPSIVPGLEHYNCMIDLLGRSGCIDEAERLLRTMPISPDVFGWMSLLTACKTYGYSHLARQCYGEIARLDPTNTSGLILLSDLLADVYESNQISPAQGMNCQADALKTPAGKAWFGAHDKVYELIVNDKTHSGFDLIHKKINCLSNSVKEKGCSFCTV